MSLIQTSILLVAAAGTSPAHGAPPAACQSECVIPFGVELGESRGIPAYSNCSPACINPEPIHTAHAGGDPVYTGIGWQCVEYARRYWLQNGEGVFGSVETAADMWSEVREVRDPRTNSTWPVQAISNGDPQLPEVGDLIIYAAEAENPQLRFGHVAVVAGRIENALHLAEQNWSNRPWETEGYSRRLSLEPGSPEIKDPQGQILGWLHVAASETTQANSLETVAPEMIKQLATALKGALKESITSGGFVAAVETCATKAPQITASIQREGYEIRRVGTRVRNQETNVPSEALLRAIQGLTPDQPGGRQIVDGAPVYLQGIFINNPLCLQCHGSEISESVSQLIQSHYPEDEAVDYEMGALRGAFVVTEK